MRIPFEKKQGPGSSISTPRPSPVALHSDDTTVTLAHPDTTTPTKANEASKASKNPSRSRARSARISEKQVTERALAQDISAVIRRRVRQGYGLGSVSLLLHILYAVGLIEFEGQIQLGNCFWGSWLGRSVSNLALAS